MKRIIDWLFGENDWIPIYAMQAKWINGDKVTNKATYEIMYSESRNNYKLKCSGYFPKEHQLYPEAVSLFYKIYYNHKQGTRLMGEVHELLNQKQEA